MLRARTSMSGFFLSLRGLGLGASEYLRGLTLMEAASLTDTVLPKPPPPYKLCGRNKPDCRGNLYYDRTI